MTLGDFDCVVDASVAIKLFINEPLATQAFALFDALRDGRASLHVPELFYIESANIFWKKVVRGDMSAQDASDSMDKLATLALIVTPMRLLATESLSIALKYQITAYDASYVELARRLHVPLVTADERLVRKMAATDPVVWIGSV